MGTGLKISKFSAGTSGKDVYNLVQIDSIQRSLDMQYVFVFCILWLSIFSDTEENAYRFTVNGKEYFPETFVLQSDTLAEGDLVRIDEVFLTIGAAKKYRTNLLITS